MLCFGPPGFTSLLSVSKDADIMTKLYTTLVCPIVEYYMGTFLALDNQKI